VLDELAMHGVKTEEIRVISPFRDVVRGSKDIARRAFASKNVGTVHTVQGQEADVIILVLGSAQATNAPAPGPPKNPTSSTSPPPAPNAGLYVIGDRNRWAVQPYFNVLASTIEH
jgi:superfamily I DNA and/or RNA helicase